MITDRFKNWRRFSLRSLFILMTLCCLLFGAWAAYVNPYRHQQRSLAVVNRLQGNTVKAPADGPPWNGWLVTTLLGQDAFMQVTEVELNGKKVTDEELGRLGGLIYLRTNTQKEPDMTAPMSDKCAHCNVEIRDQSTMVQRDGKTFCCNNCAMAMQNKPM